VLITCQHLGGVCTLWTVRATSSNSQTYPFIVSLEVPLCSFLVDVARGGR